MLPQAFRHRRRVLEERRENSPVSVDDRVARVEHVERRRPVVGVDDDLHAIADVVDAIAAEHGMARVRERIGRGESVCDP